MCGLGWVGVGVWVWAGGGGGSDIVYAMCV